MSLLDQTRQAKSAHKAHILARPNVVGMGVGYRVTRGQVSDELSIVVLVRQKIPAQVLSEQALVPQEVSGIRTDVIEVGDLRPLSANTQRWRPSPAGVSVGHYKVTAGTLGCVVRDRSTGKRMILSNNHVLANVNAASPGDPILQPGVADGGQVERDTLAHLERFCPLDFGTAPATCDIARSYAALGNALARLAGSRHQIQAFQSNPKAENQVDAALARPVDDQVLLDEIMEIGTVTGIALAELGMAVRKSGRTTSFTTGEITVLDASVKVNYGYGAELTASFEGQIVGSAMSQGGDSGSLVVASDAPLAVGLLFAGSDQATIFSPIQVVMEKLDFVIGGTVKKGFGDRQAAIEKAQAVRLLHQDELMAKANVVGVGVGLRHTGQKRTETVALIVMVSKKLPRALLDPQDVIPSEIDGVPVDVKEVGEVRADNGG
ncbi:MAG: hypothetical protein JXB15_11850 [Anaerolineales bacterium]|nr:hypothetical protein [Anaerolineales bacterium]